MPRNIYAHAVGVERTPSGRRLAVSRIVDAPADEVWELLTDTTRWPEWGPSVAAVDCSERSIAQGTRGRLRVAGVGVWVPFVVDSYTDHGDERRWTWTVARVPATGHRVDALDGQCRVTFEVPLLAAGYVPVCRRALDRIARLVAHGGSDASDADG
ncbi:SRPBCC family protein [Salinigranum salinum]|uniref:SRPBCC family protein n=1 Tax=Salinigranum salinum TaxID=1364937 RepID=UPI0012608BA8|nr:SRPBCC family protein [Salinigranum salinum]